MDTKKLRQKILDLAIRGKLVPQDPNDEPASVLLERIRAEKERLIKEGKIKRSKKSAVDDEIEAPFEIPESWEWIRFGEYLDVRDGTHDTPKYVEKGYPFVTSKNLSHGRIDFTNVNYISESDHLLFSKRSFVEDGDILFAMIGSIGNPVLVKKDREFSIKNVALFKPFDKNSTNMLFVYYFLCYFQNELKNKSKGGMQPFVPLNLFRNDILIPIPPSKEQNRIIYEVDRWLTLIDELESNEGDLLKAIDKAKSKILDLAIHGKLIPQDPNDEPAIELLKRINPKFEPCDEKDSLTLPTSWQLCSVKDVFQINPKTNASDSLDAAFVPMSSIEDQYNNKFVFETKKWGVIKRGYTHFQDGDIAVAKISPCLENRKSVVLKDMPNGIGAGTTELNVFRSEIVNPVYGLFFFKSNLFISRCVGTFNGVVGQQRVATKIIEDIDFPIPPLSEQKRIVAKIEDLFAVLDSIKDSLEN